MRSNNVIQKNLDYFDMLKRAMQKDAYGKIAIVWKRKVAELRKAKAMEEQARMTKKSTNSKASSKQPASSSKKPTERRGTQPMKPQPKVVGKVPSSSKGYDN